MSKKTIIGACAAIGCVAAVGTTQMDFRTSYSATVVRVLDGDTIELDVHLAPGQTQRIKARERNLDTPEKRRGNGGAKCDYEIKMGKQVSGLVSVVLPVGTRVRFDNVGLGKYAGRWVGDIRFARGGEIIDLGDWLIAAGKAVAYDGGRKTSPWCKDQSRLEPSK